MSDTYGNAKKAIFCEISDLKLLFLLYLTIPLDIFSFY